MEVELDRFAEGLVDGLLESGEGRRAFGVEEVGGAAAAVVGGTEAGDGHAKTRGLFQDLREVLLEFAVGKGIPDLDRLGLPQEIIYVPVRLSDGFEVMSEPCAEAAGAEGAADVGVKAGDEVVSAEAPDFQPFHAGQEGNQDVSPSFLR